LREYRLWATEGEDASRLLDDTPVGLPGFRTAELSADQSTAVNHWLKPDEEKRYEKGEHVFELPTQAAKVAVE
jgi:hypothetical protein